MPRDNLIRILAENAWMLQTPDPRSGAANLVGLLEKEIGPVPVALPASTAPQQVDFLARQVEDLRADKVTLQAELKASGETLMQMQALRDELAKQVSEEFAKLREQIETLTAERDAAREAGQQALEQLKKRKTADAVATLTDAAPAETPPATDQAAA